MDRGDTDLPVFSHIALELQDRLSRDTYNMSDISEIIHKDQTLATQILKVGNSAFFRGLKPVMTIQDTIVRLGIKNIVDIVMMVTQKQAYRSERQSLNGLMDRLWRHALAAALVCRYLANRLSLDKTSEVGFLAGLIHDIGKLPLVKIIEDLQKSESLPGEISEELINDLMLAELQVKMEEQIDSTEKLLRADWPNA